MLRLPPKKTIPVWRILDPYCFVKKFFGTFLKKARTIPKKRARAACPTQIESNMNEKLKR